MSPVWQVRYCEGWDGELVGTLSEATARQRDTEGRQYAVALSAPGWEWPEVLIEVCWAARYACAWHFDGQGRRSRKFELRRLREDQVFLLRDSEWTYDEEAPDEFDERAAYRERVYDVDGKGQNLLWRLGQNAGGLSQQGIHVDPAGLVRAYQGFGDWAALSRVDVPALEVLAEVDGREVVPPWQPPRPLQPRNVDVMFEPGTILTHPDFDDVEIDVEEVAHLVLPTGTLAVHDPAWLEFTHQLTLFELEPGTYPVQLSVLRVPGEGGGMTAGARVLFRDEPVVSWELAVPRGQNAAMLGDGAFYGFGVDAGMACLFDHEALAAFQRVVEETGEKISDFERDEALVLTAPDSDANLIVFSSGYGDGSYPAWIGRTGDGKIACFVADLRVLARATVH
jgi:hypothetical protein